MRTYKVTTVKGIVECYEQNGCYRCLYFSDLEKYIYCDILSIECINSNG